MNSNPSQLETKILSKVHEIETWFRQAWKTTPPPLMTSVDLRNAGIKIAPVDTNLFPAGFCNLNEDFLPLCVQAIQSTIFQLHPTCRHILIIPEAHTRNEFYYKSLNILCSIMKKAGFQVTLGHWDFSGEISGLQVFKLERVGNTLFVNGEEPCVVVLNNDLTEGTPDILKGLGQKMFPDPMMGWEHRRKSQHFRIYQELAEEFARLIDCDPWLICAEMGVVNHVDFMAKKGIEAVAATVDHILEQVRDHYAQYELAERPFAVVKPDNGTYGMGVMSVHDGQSLLSLNRKQRTRMSAIKGGGAVRRVLVQEGVYTFETMADGAVAEPVIYMIGSHVVGGFYRVHRGKGIDESLNAPGMEFEPLAFDVACNMPSTEPRETNKSVTQEIGIGQGNALHKTNLFYVYSVIARLAALAAGREEQET